MVYLSIKKTIVPRLTIVVPSIVLNPAQATDDPVDDWHAELRTFSASTLSKHVQSVNHCTYMGYVESLLCTGLYGMQLMYKYSTSTGTILSSFPIALPRAHMMRLMTLCHATCSDQVRAFLREPRELVHIIIFEYSRPTKFATPGLNCLRTTCK